jgi:uncharacterized membrane protein YeiH
MLALAGESQRCWPPKAQTPINAQVPRTATQKHLPSGERCSGTHRRSKPGIPMCPVKLSGTGDRGEGHRLSLELCVLTTVYLIAITAEAMSGALAAGKRQMDMFGVVLIAFITALGGGTVRDMLQGNFPVNWTQHPSYIYLTITAGLMTMVVARFMHRLQQLFLILDAMGLVAFTIIGCNVALALNYDLPVVIMSGVITGIFGGILRDILCNQTPQVLQKELYASVSLLVAGLYLTLHDAGFDHDLTLLASFSCGLALRLIAIRWQLSLPVFSYSPERWQD